MLFLLKTSGKSSKLTNSILHAQPKGNKQSVFDSTSSSD